MNRHRSPIEAMVDAACGYDPNAPIQFTSEQEKVLETLSQQDPGRFAIGVGAALGFINFEQTPNIKVPEVVIEFIQSFMSDEPLPEVLE